MICKITQAEERTEAIREELENKQTMLQQLQIEIKGHREKEQKQEETAKAVTIAIDRLQEKVLITKATMIGILTDLRIRPSAE